MLPVSSLALSLTTFLTTASLVSRKSDNPIHATNRIVEAVNLPSFQARKADGMRDSTQKNRTKKPPKPYPTFPLSFHPSGRFCKKIRGKLHYFGYWAKRQNGELTTIDNPDEAAQTALDAYLEVKDDLHAGRTPRRKADGVSVEDACNAFMESREDRLDAGELTTLSFASYLKVGKLVAEYFGRNRLVSDLAVSDFSKFRAWLVEKKKHGVHVLAKDVRVTRMIFKYACDSELIDNPVRFGPDFKEPSKKSKRKASREAGRKDYNADEIRRLLAVAECPIRAMILLGINCGFGQSDIASLPLSAVDLENGWIDFPRPKTEINRRCPLWPETVEALREVLEKRPTPIDDADADCLFITRKGRRFVWSTDGSLNRVDAVMQRFTRLKTKTGINGRRGFYGLRHTFETVGGESRDQVAVDSIMGHVDPSMAANYRHRISDERLRDVVKVVRVWLWPEEKAHGESKADDGTNADEATEGVAESV